MSFLDLKELKIVRFVSQSFNQLAHTKISQISRLQLSVFNLKTFSTASLIEYKNIWINGYYSKRNFMDNKSPEVVELLDDLWINVENLIVYSCKISDQLYYDVLNKMKKLKTLQLLVCENSLQNRRNNNQRRNKSNQIIASFPIIEDMKILCSSYTQISFNRLAINQFFKAIASSLRRFEIQFKQLKFEEWKWFASIDFNLEYLTIRTLRIVYPKVLEKFIKKITGQLRFSKVTMNRLKLLDIEIGLSTRLDANLGVIDFRKLSNLHVSFIFKFENTN